ncbi:hypothetical protein D9619_009928 [Psilocybe cf. subviscida]|uniref:Uncharacterized protein n=1 Tax=Psilocybe cf. subviscida TaxID=2480587 RepID=A0A8H5BL92_9AGAR|nr:hypothetical protein D9619_009928 [Psilocybe cf. subviscida]
MGTMYRGGGVGRASIREAINHFLRGHHPSDVAKRNESETAAFDSGLQSADSGNEEDGDMANSDSDERERDSRSNESEAERSEGHDTDSEDGEQCGTDDEGDLSDDELGPEAGERGVADEELLGFAMDYTDGINHNGVKIIALIWSIL